MLDPKGIQAGAAYVKIFLEDSGLHRGLARAGRRLQRFGANLAGTGRSLLGFAAVAALPFAVAVKTFTEFDDAIRQVGAVTQATTEQFNRLKASALELGRTTSFTAGQVANLQTELGRAGFTPDEIIESTPHVLNLARATGTELAEAAKYAGQTLRQFRMETSETARVADVLAATANRSNNTLGSIAEAMEYAGPVAADFNMSIEETAALIGVLGNVGIQGSNAGTALRRLLTLNGAEAEKLNGIFGVTFRDAAGDARPLVDVLGEVQEATKDLGSGERAAKFNEAFGLLGITGASAIAGSVSDARELYDGLLRAQGVAADTAAEMDAGIGGAWRRLMSAAEGLALKVGEALAPKLEELSAWITDHLPAITEWVGKNRDLIVTIVKWIAGIAAAGAALIVFGSAISAAGSAVGLFSTALGLVLAHPVAAAFTASAVAIGYFAKKTYEANEAIMAFNEQLERRNKLEGKLTAVTNARQKAELDALKAEEDPAARAAAARERIEFETREQASAAAALRGSQARVDSYGGFARWTGNKQLELDELEVADRKRTMAEREAYLAELTQVAERAEEQAELLLELEDKKRSHQERIDEEIAEGRHEDAERLRAEMRAAGEEFAKETQAARLADFGDLDEQARLARAGKNDDLKLAPDLEGLDGFESDVGAAARSAAAASALDLASAEGQRLAATLLNGTGGGPAQRTADAAEALLQKQGEANVISERIERQLDVKTFEYVQGVA